MIGFDLKMRERFILDLCERFPVIERGSIGSSLCNRDIPYLKIGSDHNPVLFAAAFHGMEWLTSLLVLLFLRRIARAMEKNEIINGIDIKRKLKENGLVVVPCVNPDGVEISLNGTQAAVKYETLINEILNRGNTTNWQANARGVDLNHNFNADWNRLHQLEQENGINGPAPTRYGGLFPESEPEIQAIVQFCKRMRFRHAIAFHSQGEEIYWHYGENTPKHAESMGKIMAKLSGYTLAEPEGLAVGGGFKDWFIEEFSRPGFTIEIGRGNNPLPLTDIEAIYKKLERMLIYCCFA